MITCRRVLSVAALIALGVCSQAAACSGDAVRSNKSDSAAAIVEKYIEACGGASLSKVETEVRKGTLVRGALGKVPFESSAKAHDKWHYNQMFAWGDQMSCGFDGSSAWVQDTKGIEGMKPGQLLDMRLIFDVRAPLKIRELFPDLTVTGAEKIGERGAVTISARSRQGIGTELAFDTETGLLLRAGKIFFNDYRTVGAVKRPYAILLGRDEGEAHMQMKMEFSDIRQNLDVDDSLFEMPSCALAPKDPPLYKSRKRADVSVEAMNACVGVYQHPQKADVVFTVSRQENHLMIHRTGWGQKIEIKPASETDYYVEFVEFDFHFVKDASGAVTHMETGDPVIKAVKIR